MVLSVAIPTLTAALELPSGKKLKQYTRVMQACQARGMSPGECQTKYFGRAKSRADDVRTMMAKCRLRGIGNAKCQRLVKQSLAVADKSVTTQVRAHCLRNRIPRRQCNALMNQTTAKQAVASQTDRIVARCKAAGMPAQTCMEKIETARRRLTTR
ncbi:MAG: hypothetical protein QF654_10855 [Alphaproteobacteria bacterium]|nr:hypothetical protein [Alphaproteobacteria bacterium]